MQKPIIYSKIINFDETTQFVTQLDPIDMGDYVFVGLQVQTTDNINELAENATAEQIVAYKIKKASKECEERIYKGFNSECLRVTKQFDCAMTDQTTIQGLTLTAIMGLSGLTTEETHWKGTGELECYKFEYAQILELATDLKRHIESNINQFNAERLAILSEMDT